MTDTITCQYSCEYCDLEKIDVDVPIRKLDQDVVDWVNNVAAQAMVDDHAKRSPFCRPQEFKQIMIPIPAGTEMIGRPVEH